MPGSPRARPTPGCRRRQATGSSRCAGKSGSAMRGAERRLIVSLAALGAAFALAAQSADPPRAPRILDAPVPPARAPAVEPDQLRVTLPSTGGVRRPPNAARLAPLPEERNDEPEEII